MTRDEAWALLTEYNKEEFHLKHAQIVEEHNTLFHCMIMIIGYEKIGNISPL